MCVCVRTVAMGKGGLTDDDDAKLPVYTWKEVGEHKDRSDRWIVINGYIYDVTSWAKCHPGGEKIIGGYAGHDASVSMSLSHECIGCSSNPVCLSVRLLHLWFVSKRKCI